MKTMIEAVPASTTNGTTPQTPFTVEVVAAEAPLRASRPRHTQSVAQAALAAAVGEMLAGLQMADEPLRTLLEQDGITTACIAACTAQHAAALAARDARQQAMAAEKQAVATLAAAFDHAYWGMTALRQVARTVFTGAAAYVALGLNEEMPHSTALFVNEVRRVLATAQQAPYAATLATVAYSTPRLQAMQREIDAVEAAYSTRCEAGQRAQQATLVRDVEFATLSRLARQVRVQVKAVLRRNPEAARPAGLF